MLRKSLALVLALALAGGAVILGAQTVLSAREDAPRFYSVAASGDPEAALGLRFSLEMTLGAGKSQLGWDVSGSPAGSLDADTRLRYESGGRRFPSSEPAWTDGIELRYPLLTSQSTSVRGASLLSLGEHGAWAALAPLLKSAAAQAAPGSTVVRYFRLADFYDECPAVLDLRLPDLWITDDAPDSEDAQSAASLRSALAQFTPALPDGAWGRLELSLDSTGGYAYYDLVTAANLDSLIEQDGALVPEALRSGSAALCSLNALSCSAATGSTIWLAAELYDDEGAVQPFASGAAAGLYRIDYSLRGRDVSFPNGSYRAQTLETGEPVLCWESEPGWQSIGITPIENGTRLLLLQGRTGTGQGGRALVFDSSGSLLRTIPLFDAQPDGDAPVITENGALVFFSRRLGTDCWESDGTVYHDLAPEDGRRCVTVLDRDASGELSAALQLVLPAADAPLIYNLDAYCFSDWIPCAAAWNRQTKSLAVARAESGRELPGSAEDNAVLEIVVLSGSGAAFSRTYASDLLQPFDDSDLLSVHANPSAGITLVWKE